MNINELTLKGECVMADSKDFRFKFWTLNLVFIGVLITIVVVLALMSKKINLKKDFTEDQIFTISDGFTNILGNLKALEEPVFVNYYTSEKMPAQLGDLRQKTQDLFEEISALSGGLVEYKIIYPEKEAAKDAETKVAKYREKMEALKAWEQQAEANRGKKPDRPKEPKQQPTTIQDFMRMQQGMQKTDEEIAGDRQKKADAMAKGSGRPADEHYYEMLQKDFMYEATDDLQVQGIGKIPFTEKQGSEVIDSAFYSTIHVKYLDKDAEVIGGHFFIENLELELATRILKLTAPIKPKVAFFDGRPPAAPTPPANPLQGPPPQRSDYQSVIGALGELFDVRQTKLEEGDSISDLQKSLLEEAKKAREEDKTKVAGLRSVEDEAKISCLIVAQPDNLEERQVFEISKAISEGIPTVFLVSRHSVDVSQGQQGGMMKGYPISFLNPGLDDYFRSLGVGIFSELLASNQCVGLPVIQQFQGKYIMVEAPAASCLLARVDEGVVNTDAALMNRIQHLVFPSTNGLSIDEKKIEELGIKVESLAWTHKHTWAKQVSPFNQTPFGQPQPTSLMSEQRDFFQRKDPDRYGDDFIEKRNLAVQLTGKIPFFFQNKKVPAWKKKEEPTPGGPGGINPHGGFPGGLPPGLVPPGRGGPAGQPQEAGEPGNTEAQNSAQGNNTPPAPNQANKAVTNESASAPPKPQENSPQPVVPAGPGTDPVKPDGSSTTTENKSGPETEIQAGGPGTDAQLTPPQPKKENKPAPQPTQDEVASVTVSDRCNVVIFNSVDALKDSFHLGQRGQNPAYQPNLMFFKNAIETFALGEDLLSIRRKTLTQRNFNPGTTSKKQNTIQTVNFLLLPGIIGAFGLAIFISRRVQASNYERQIQRQSK